MVAVMAWLALLPACGDRGELLGTKEKTNQTLRLPPRYAAPQLVTALSSTGYEEDPTFTGDLLDLWFMSGRGGTNDIWTSHRAAPSEPWGAPVLVAELSSPAARDWAPAIAADGLTIWFTTDRDGGRAQTWRSSRTTREVPWEAPVAVSELASGAVDRGPAVDQAERSLYFSSDRPGSSGFDIYISTRPAVNALWETPARAPGINTANDELDPFIAAEGLLLFFTAEPPGSGDANLYWSARSSTADSWSAVVPLDALNSPTYDSDASLSLDMNYIMFSSTRTGDGEIYEAHALP
jgi:hypothetical protein